MAIHQLKSRSPVFRHEDGSGASCQTAADGYSEEPHMASAPGCSRERNGIQLSFKKQLPEQ
jgi:hypothetical protein